MNAMGRLIRAEIKLMVRDPLVLTFVFAFPVVTMLIIGGAFGTAPNPGFDHTDPAHWYVASYLTVTSLDEVRLAVGLLHPQGDGGATTPLPGADGLPALTDRFHPHRAGPDQCRDRGRARGGRGHGQDPHQPPLRQAAATRPRCRGDLRLRPRPGHPRSWALTPAGRA
jgi:hypothetical protein